jgi:membrane protein
MITRGRSLAGRASELFPIRVIRTFADTDGASKAIVIAWNALTAIFPIALAVAAVGGFVLSAAGVTSTAIIRQLLSVLPPDLETQSAALRGIEALQDRALLFFGLALIGFIWTGSSLFGGMETAFATVFRTPNRPFLRQKLMGLGMMGIFAVLALVAVGTSAMVPLLSRIPDLPISLTRGWTAPVLQAVIGAVAGFLLFYAIYYVVPYRRQRALRVLPGALFAGMAFEALTLLFPTFIQFNQGINMYGRNFAFLFILLTFFYALGVITMVGAVIIALVDPPVPDRGPTAPPPPRPMGRFRRTTYGALALVLAVVLGRRAR